MSGLYIPGMEMPEDCDSCANTKCSLWLGIEKGQRHENCPLVAVPDHGRLIDADVIETGVGILLKEYFLAGEEEDFKRALVDLVFNAPTVIPADEDEPNMDEAMAEFAEEEQ